MTKISNLHTYKETKNNSFLLIWESTKAYTLTNRTSQYNKQLPTERSHKRGSLSTVIISKKYLLSALMPVCNERGSTLLLCRENLLKRLSSPQSISISACHIFPALLSVPVLLCLQETLSRPFNKSKSITYR